MWVAPVLHRLGQCRLKPVPEQDKPRMSGSYPGSMEQGSVSLGSRAT